MKITISDECIYGNHDILELISQQMPEKYHKRWGRKLRRLNERGERYEIVLDDNESTDLYLLKPHKQYSAKIWLCGKTLVREVTKIVSSAEFKIKVAIYGYGNAEVKMVVDQCRW